MSGLLKHLRSLWVHGRNTGLEAEALLTVAVCAVGLTSLIWALSASVFVFIHRELN